MTDFQGLGLDRPILRALEAEGYSAPTPIQAQAIPHLMTGRDLLGIAQTGTGKTAAFALPMLHRLAHRQELPTRRTTRALVLAPTRELAGQIHESFRTYGRHLGLRQAVVFGGVPIRRQMNVLSRGVDILVATPGRLLDLINQNAVSLAEVEIFVLDEADRMLDMGFIHDVKRIAALVPAKRQTIFLSATMPKTVGALADGLLTDPARVEVAPQATTAERIEQQVLFVSKADKRPLLIQLMRANTVGERVLVFTRTKHGADRVAKQLGQAGITADAIHGNKAQNARERALNGFRSGRVRALVATDIAARGIDVDGVTHVVNFDLPNEPESYVHRIGRTARAGAEGMAISFCDFDERAYLRDIEKTIRAAVPVNEEHEFHDPAIAAHTGQAKKGGSAKGRGGRGQQPRGDSGRGDSGRGDSGRVESGRGNAGRNASRRNQAAKDPSATDQFGKGQPRRAKAKPAPTQAARAEAKSEAPARTKPAKAARPMNKEPRRSSDTPMALVRQLEAQVQAGPRGDSSGDRPLRRKRRRAA